MPSIRHARFLYLWFPAIPPLVYLGPLRFHVHSFLVPFLPRRLFSISEVSVLETSFSYLALPSHSCSLPAGPASLNWLCNLVISSSRSARFSSSSAMICKDRCSIMVMMVAANSGVKPSLSVGFGTFSSSSLNFCECLTICANLPFGQQYNT